MSNKVRGDYELDTLAVELIQKLNSLRVSLLKAASFEEQALGMLQNGAFVELWTLLVRSLQIDYGKKLSLMAFFDILATSGCARLAFGIYAIHKDDDALWKRHVYLLLSALP